MYARSVKAILRTAVGSCGSRTRTVSDLSDEARRRSSIHRMAQLDQNCIFCKILSGQEPGEKVYEDDHVACIKDIHPASTHHYLIIPKTHIPNAKVLTQKDEEIFDKLVATVDVVAELQGFDLSSVRTGFHWPPFNTINHLHLHVIAPLENMDFLRRIMFKPNSWWFVGTDYVKSHIQSSL
ncbi:histidine triad nucleotide-binding protein 3-like isoform X2 [Orussus abietinus]|uniref:histidine triad nucleotide-binding protein 3-like isoform X2 n=1 Tax=Orussus abietinus TaxID=222816 RepID=UPI000C715EB7|nr:histidine triad nucleotide-binding protein 3-like isoform X2 [Orussus abietinus]